MHTITELQERQALPLKLKIAMTKTRIREWINRYSTDGVYVSFSGGKDSTVLLDIVREDYPNVKAMFVDVPTQYPELKQFVKTFDNVDIVAPKINFFQVCEKYGFPLFSKEVSEKVYYAQKYLKWYLGNNGGGIRKNKTPTGYAFADLMGVLSRNDERYNQIQNGEIPNDLLEEIFSSNSNAPFKAKALFGTVIHKENGKITTETSQRFDFSAYKFMINAPFSLSNKCCDIMKKNPAHRYAKETGRMPITAQMASESRLRTQKWLQFGRNAFEAKEPMSNPMSFWTEQDVLLYIKERNLPICSVYGEVVTDDEEMGQMQLSDYEGMELFDLGRQPLHCTGCDRTGCVCCGFGAHIQGDDRFIRLKETHPQMYKILDVAKNNGYTMRQAIDWIAEHSNKIIKY